MARELLNSAAFFALAVLVALGGLRLGLGTVGEPGPGVYPVVLAVVLGGLAAWLAVATLLRPPRIASRGARHAGQLAATIATLVGYIALTPLAGAAVTTVALLAVLFRVGGMTRWPRIAAFALAFGLGAVFGCRLIGIPLPAGELWDTFFARET
ncbi:MAG: tripartite tricarboxylate transporter TctB family protein [Burkholderiales bacterium]|nr:tripartite tricarboxylate transporter TctB family protein [Burkholderiales bacterium]